MKSMGMGKVMSNEETLGHAPKPEKVREAMATSTPRAMSMRDREAKTGQKSGMKKMATSDSYSEEWTGGKL